MRVETPEAPSVRFLRKEKATEAVPDLLRDTGVGCWAAVMAIIGPREEGGDLSEWGAGEGEAGPALDCISFLLLLLFLFSPLSQGARV